MKEITIGYLGPQGSFSEEALWSFMQRRFPALSPNVLTDGFATIPQVINACAKNQIDWAFVPVENSTEGQVSSTLDCVMESEELFIYEEFIHPVNQCLLTPRPMPLDQIQRVYSHPQGLGQCRGFLEDCLGQAEQIVSPSTAEAAQIVARSGLDWAAIAPRRAGELYGLYCQKENVQDNAENSTRFILVGHQLREFSGTDKTSLLLRITDHPGSLCQVLQEFSSRDINLTRIESRPSKMRLGEYVFFIDVEGYVFNPNIQEALWALKMSQVAIRLLGSYPRHV